MDKFVIMMDNSIKFYKTNANLNVAFRQIGTMEKRCEKFINQLEFENDKNAIQNTLDSLVLTDEVLVLLVDNFDFDISKQLNFVKSQNLDDEMLKLKERKKSVEDYIHCLSIAISKIKLLMNYLEKTSSDLVRIERDLGIVESNYNYVMEIAEEKRLYSAQAREYVASEFGKRIATHAPSLDRIVKSKENIKELLALYKSMVSTMNREIEIVKDLSGIKSTSNNIAEREK